jgi:hypothetical protein
VGCGSCNTQEDGILRSHRSENLKSYILLKLFLPINMMRANSSHLVQEFTKQTNSVAPSPQANYTD